jgi:tetratricopeptide (TPR) repeat protein
MGWLYARGIPIEAQYLYQKALDMSRKGKDEVALKYFRQAVIIAPGYATAFFEMGNCLARLGRYGEAREKYEQASHIDAGSRLS